MPKAISPTEVKSIAGMIRDWPKSQPFKWEAICAGATSILGYQPTRQALSKKPLLSVAYRQKKQQLKAATEQFKHIPRPQSISDAIERIAKLQEENDSIKSELSRMAEIANRFIYNSSIAGLARAKLMKPIPSKK